METVTGDAILVAAVQMEPVLGDLEANLGLMRDAIEEAAGNGAGLIVLPELASSGYMFANRAEAALIAERIPDGPTTDVLCDLAMKHEIFIVAGLAEVDGPKLFNSAVLVGPDGYIGTYRKVHLWNNETMLFEPGDLGLPVFPTSIGRIGMMICYDAWFPEAFRTLALASADVVCLPTNWVPIPGQVEGKGAMAVTLCQAAAHVNSLHVIAADRIGVERGQEFIGQSVIVGPAGWPLADPASSDQPQLVIATTELKSGRALRNWNSFNDPLGNRRPSEYRLGAIDG